MSYASRQNLIDRFGSDELRQLTDRARPPSGSIDDAVIDAALADADGIINGYLAVRMTTPVSPVPRILELRACQIARYLLWKGGASEAVQSGFDDALAWLKDVSAGKVSLGDDVAATDAPNAGTPKVTAPSRQFTRDRLRDF